MISLRVQLGSWLPNFRLSFLHIWSLRARKFAPLKQFGPWWAILGISILFWLLFRITLKVMRASLNVLRCICFLWTLFHEVGRFIHRCNVCISRQLVSSVSTCLVMNLSIVLFMLHWFWYLEERRILTLLTLLPFVKSFPCSRSGLLKRVIWLIDYWAYSIQLLPLIHLWLLGCLFGWNELYLWRFEPYLDHRWPWIGFLIFV